MLNRGRGRAARMRRRARQPTCRGARVAATEGRGRGVRPLLAATEGRAHGARTLRGGRRRRATIAASRSAAARERR